MAGVKPIIQKTKNKQDKVPSVFEPVYAVIFYIALATIIRVVLSETGNTFDDLIIVGIFILFVVFQYSKVYYVLHKLEEPHKSSRHFLDALGEYGMFMEKSLRMLIIFVLVSSVKSPKFLPISEIIGSPNYASLAYPAINAFLVILLLIMWDTIVFWSLKRRTDLEENVKTQYQEFTASDSVRYFSFRLLERVLALALSILVIFYTYSKQSVGPAYYFGAGILLASFMFLVYLCEKKGTPLGSPEVNFLKKLAIIFFFFPIIQSTKVLLGGFNVFNKDNKIIYGGAHVLVGALICVIAFFASSVAHAVDEHKEKVTLSTSKNIWCALPLIAIQNKYFEQEGLDVDPVYQAAGVLNLNAVISGSANFGTIVEVNLAYLAYTDTPDLSVIGTVVKSNDFSVVARKAKGLTSPENLKGKKIGYSSTTGGEPFLYKFLERYHLSPSDVILQKIQPNLLVSALMSNSVDAIATWEPFATVAANGLHDSAAVFHESGIYTGYMNVAVRNSWASKHPETTKKFLRALKRAEEFIKTNPAAAKKQLAGIINLDGAVVDKIWPLYTIGVGLDVDQQVEATSYVAKLAQKIQPEFKNAAIPDYRRYFDPAYLNSATK